jgi:multidrug efflux system membrane fusion protein
MLVITQMEPIAVIFTLPEDGLQAVVKEMGQGQLPVKAFSRDDGTQLATGNLLTIDNEIDPTTGTYKLKAVFDNKDRALWPNQFVNARLLLNTEKGAIVVPTAAIQRGSQGTFVYRVQQGNTVEAEPVTVRLNQGNVTSIASGLNAGDLVVTEGQDRLRAGMTVDPRQATTDADGAPIPGAAGGPAAPADSQASGAPGGPQGFGHGPQGYGQGQDYGHKPQDGSQQGQQFHHDHPQNGGSPDGGSNGYQGKPQSRLGDINGSPVTQQ